MWAYPISILLWRVAESAYQPRDCPPEAMIVEDHCPHCQRDIDRMVEKGVDAAIVTALFRKEPSTTRMMLPSFCRTMRLHPGNQDDSGSIEQADRPCRLRTGGSEVRTATWSHILLDGDIADRLIEEAVILSRSRNPMG
jgi:hypothetical protein